MRREHHRWHSPSLGRDMELLVFGHGGARVLVFPTSMGRYFEWEDRGMLATVGDHIANGWIQLFCVDSVDGESWYAKQRHPHDRARRHEQYERYLIDEVMPFTRQNPNPFLIATGASFGAYHALNLGLRHPGLVGRVLGLSGLYDIKEMTGGYSDDAVYFQNPSDYLAHEHDHGRLEALRLLDIVLVVGRDDAAHGNNEYLSRVLHSKHIPHKLHVWNGWYHDWPHWREMIRLYLGG